MANRIVPPPGGAGRGVPAGPPRQVGASNVRGLSTGPTVRTVSGPRTAVPQAGPAQQAPAPSVKRIPPPSSSTAPAPATRVVTPAAAMSSASAPAPTPAPTPAPGTAPEAFRSALVAIDRVVAENGSPAAVQACAAALRLADDHLRALLASPPAAPAAASNGAAKPEDEAKKKAEDARKDALAKQYRGSACVLRRRAARADRTEEQKAEELARADYFERRALVMEERGFMPRELRTPRESIVGVDYFRRALASLQNSLFDLEAPEVGMLAGAVVGDATRPMLKLGSEGTDEMATAVQRTAQLFNAWRTGSEGLLAALGASRTPFQADGAAPAEPWEYAQPGDVAIDAAAGLAGRLEFQDTAPASEASAATPPAQP